MGWNLARVQLSGGVGNVNIRLPEPGLFTAVSIPQQSGLTSGASDIAISSLLPNGQLAGALLTLTNPTLPYFESPQTNPVNETGIVQSTLVYNTVQDINVSVTSGSGNGTVDIWLFTI